MLPFVTSQAITLSQKKEKAKTSPINKQGQAPSIRENFLSRLFRAMADARTRQAEAELRYHRGWHEETLKR